MRITPLSIAAGLIAMGLGPAQAVEDYDSCLALVGSDPGLAEAEAGKWQRFGGGQPALHCRALALEALGAWRQAANLLIEMLETGADLPDQVRSDIATQAGELLLSAGDAEKAGQLSEQALHLSPKSRAGLILKASIEADQRRWDASIRTLGRLLELRGPDAEALILRAAAKRQAGDRIGARNDALWALELDAGAPGNWLELGQIEADLGHRNEARQALLKAIELARPDPDMSHIARLARRRLQDPDLAS